MDVRRKIQGGALELRPLDSKIIDSFEMRLVDIGTVDVEQLQALSISVGWPHRAQDWRSFLDCGKGYVALDEIGRLIGSAMWFPYSDAFVMIGMMITSPRLQTNGAGHWLMEHVLAQCAGRRIGLNATRAARRLYLSLGFVPGRKVYQCQGIARSMPEAAPNRAGERLRKIDRNDLEALSAMDAQAFGADRTGLLARLFDRGTAYGLFRAERLVAYALCRPFGRGYVVGPVVATTDADSISVVRPHVADHDKDFLRLDTHRETGPFATFLSQVGLPVYDTVLSMSLPGDEKQASQKQCETPAIYGLASQAFG